MISVSERNFFSVAITRRGAYSQYNMIHIYYVLFTIYWLYGKIRWSDFSRDRSRSIVRFAKRLYLFCVIFFLRSLTSPMYIKCLQFAAAAISNYNKCYTRRAIILYIYWVQCARRIRVTFDPVYTYVHRIRTRSRLNTCTCARAATIRILHARLWRWPLRVF